MTLLQQNTAAGGTDGAAVTTGNSGGASGDAFALVSPGTSGTITYRAADAFRGGLCLDLDQSTAGNAILVGYTDTADPSAAARAYMMLLSLPSTTGTQIGIAIRGNAGVTALVRTELTATNQLRVVSGSTGAATTLTLAANTWYRVELTCTAAGTASTVATCSIFAGDSTAALETVTATGTTAYAADAARFGKFNTPAPSRILLKDVAANIGSSAMLGPSVTATPVVGTDTSTFSEVSQLTVAVGASDAATQTEATTVVAVAMTASDASTLVETATETVAGNSDDAQLVLEQADVTAAAAAADTQTVTEASQLTVTLSAVDTQAQTEGVTAATAAVAGSDAQAQTEGAARIGLSAIDGWTLTDTSDTSATLTASDTWTLTEGATSVNTGANPGAFDVLAQTEQPADLTAGILGSDTSTFSETSQLTVALVAVDASTFAEASQTGAAMAAMDAQSQTEGAATTGVALAATDASVFTESPGSLNQGATSVSATDISVFTESSQLTVTLSAVDTQAQTEGVTAGTAALTATDASVLIETSSPTVRLTAVDTSTFAETSLLSTGGSPPVQQAAVDVELFIGPPFTEWTATPPTSDSPGGFIRRVRPMRVDSIEYIWVSISGTYGWTTQQVSMSLNNGATWANAVVEQSTIQSIALPSGRIGQSASVRVLASDLPLAVGAVRVEVRVVTDAETPRIDAGYLLLT